jgi:hypothetical protein
LLSTDELLEKRITMKSIFEIEGGRFDLLPLITVLCISIISSQGCVPPEYYYEDDSEEITVFEDIEEAEQIALYLDDSVTLNRFLLKRVFFDITLIRGAFGNEAEALETIKFNPPCKNGRIMIVFDREIYPTVLEGEYKDWDELNGRYQPYDVKTIDRLRKIYLYFDGPLNYRALAAKYAELPHIESASCVGHVGDSPNIYPRRTDTGIDYLFRDAWGTCSAGCTNNEFYYFVCENDDAVYIGRWNPEKRLKPPEWWSAARKCLPEELRERF